MAAMIGIKERRAAAGLSQEDLAAASGVDIRTVRRIETDAAYMPRMVNAKRIAQVLGTTIDDLIHEDDSDTPATAGVKSQCGPTPNKKRAASTTQGA